MILQDTVLTSELFNSKGVQNTAVPVLERPCISQAWSRAVFTSEAALRRHWKPTNIRAAHVHRGQPSASPQITLPAAMRSGFEPGQSDCRGLLPFLRLWSFYVNRRGSSCQAPWSFIRAGSLHPGAGLAQNTGATGHGSEVWLCCFLAGWPQASYATSASLGVVLCRGSLLIFSL